MPYLAQLMELIIILESFGLDLYPNPGFESGSGTYCNPDPKHPQHWFVFL
jgi:hypothetical protein